MSTIDAYCERVGPEFWAEPLNAATNLAFVVAGIAVIALVYRDPRLSVRRVLDISLLGMLIVAIGVASFLWHTFATPWSGLSDVLSIQVFITVFLISYGARATAFGWRAAIGLPMIYYAAGFALAAVVSADALNGSAYYLPALFGLFVIAFFERASRTGEATLYLSAVLVFVVSLTLRSVDEALCGMLPIGTHYLWHLLNAVTLYLLCYALVRRASGDC